MKATLYRAGEEIVLDDYTIGSSGGNADDTFRFEITRDNGEPWLELVMDAAEALEIGAWGTQWLALRMLERSAERDATSKENAARAELSGDLGGTRKAENLTGYRSQAVSHSAPDSSSEAGARRTGGLAPDAVREVK